MNRYTHLCVQLESAIAVLKPCWCANTPACAIMAPLSMQYLDTHTHTHTHASLIIPFTTHHSSHTHTHTYTHAHTYTHTHVRLCHFFNSYVYQHTCIPGRDGPVIASTLPLLALHCHSHTRPLYVFSRSHIHCTPH